MSRIALRVNGNEFSGWMRARVTYGIDSICGGFELSVTDRWSGEDGEQPWPINVADEVTIQLNETTIIDGWVDSRECQITAEGRVLRVSGRDRASALVDCSVAIGASQFKNITLQKLAQKLCEPHGIGVKLGPGVDTEPVHLTSKKHASSVTGAGSSGKRAGLKSPKPGRKFTIDPGETAWSALEKACQLAGCLAVSDHQGGIVLTRPGSERTKVSLIEGQNVLSASAKYSGTQRYRKYVVRSQQPGNDFLSGKAAAAVSGVAEDQTVRRRDRVLVILPGVAMTAEQARMRAAWEMKVRAARSAEVSVVVQGWSQNAPPNGAAGPAYPIWPVNALVQVKIPSVGLVDEQGRPVEMLISEATFSVDDQQGETTELTLKRKDAYLPEPLITPETGQPWDEIKFGVK